MLKKTLFTMLAMLSAIVLMADLVPEPGFEYNIVGPEYTGDYIQFASDTLWVTNTGSTEEFSLTLQTSEIPDGWSVMWCHEYEDALCHFPNFPWSFNFMRNTQIGIDFSLGYSNSPGMVELDLYWESNTISEVMHFTFQTEDFVDTDSNELPAAATLGQNYPNPFNPETNISFSLASSENANLSIYNLKGELVKNLVNNKLDAGDHTYSWQGRNDQNNEVPSGVYFYQLKTDTNTITKKMIMMK